jgi:hypothetical protein
MAMAKRTSESVSASFEYIRSHAWLWWAFGGLACAALCVSRASLRAYVWDHASVALLLPLPVVLVAWLVAGAEDAREKLGSGQSCRRQ